MSIMSSYTFDQQRQSAYTAEYDRDDFLQETQSDAQSSMLVCDAWKHLRNVVVPELGSIQEEKDHARSMNDIISDTKSFTTITAKTQNFLLMWGCRPSEGILSDQMTIKGIPWSILKHKLLDQTFDA